MRKLIAIGAVALTLAGCESAIRGAPEAKLIPAEGQKAREPLSRYVLNARLSETAVTAALTDQNKPGVGRAHRNQVIFARMAEIDALYNAYETAVLTESRKAGFGLSFASAIAGLLGGFTNGETSQIFSLIGGGVGAAQTSFDKEILAESTIQAFVSQMRAARAKVRSDIYQKLIAPTAFYPIEAALIDLQDYVQAGTLASAIAGISESASTEARDQERAATASEGKLFNHTISDDPVQRTTIERLLAYVALSDANTTEYLKAAKAAGLPLLPETAPKTARAIDAITGPANAAKNQNIADGLNL